MDEDQPSEAPPVRRSLVLISSAWGKDKSDGQPRSWTPRRTTADTERITHRLSSIHDVLRRGPQTAHVAKGEPMTGVKTEDRGAHRNANRPTRLDIDSDTEETLPRGRKQIRESPSRRTPGTPRVRPTEGSTRQLIRDIQNSRRPRRVFQRVVDIRIPGHTSSRKSSSNTSDSSSHAEASHGLANTSITDQDAESPTAKALLHSRPLMSPRSQRQPSKLAPRNGPERRRASADSRHRHVAVPEYHCSSHGGRDGVSEQYAIYRNACVLEFIDLFSILKAVQDRMLFNHEAFNSIFEWWGVFRRYLLHILRMHELVLFPWKEVATKHAQALEAIVAMIEEFDEQEQSSEPYDMIFPELLRLSDVLSRAVFLFLDDGEASIPVFIMNKFPRGVTPIADQMRAYPWSVDDRVILLPIISRWMQKTVFYDSWIMETVRRGPVARAEKKFERWTRSLEQSHFSVPEKLWSASLR
uniref:Uncharacterized protein n=1 Tax=Compsopogon caeruleus TaxID=31354 RepID=A0A7S1TEU7_9RHOD|mmetsp:Transcript_2954/g.5622  ORF Transcript_2954/g.5622 Transcript_2954/m.5622 type:complete len:469 (+) Transcript_2954:166-1572(+)